MRLRRSTTLRRIAVSLLAAVGLILAGASPALAHQNSSPRSPAVYLALGDSVPFGYFRSSDTSIYANPANFVGYPAYVAHDLGLRLLNASCPGETTDSFIDAAAQSNGCENSPDPTKPGYRTVFPLHVSYTGSQLDYAIRVLETTPNVRLVTIMLGANDGFLCEEGVPTNYCSGPTDFAGVAQHVRTNLSLILGKLRATGYHGRIVAVTYYSLNYADAQQTQGALILNGGIVSAAVANQASVASGFLAFLGRSLRAGGDPVNAGLVRPGDVHPTPKGQRLLANAVEAALRL